MNQVLQKNRGRTDSNGLGWDGWRLHGEGPLWDAYKGWMKVWLADIRRKCLLNMF